MNNTPNQKQGLLFYIDIVGSCNLTCPSCPVENSKATNNFHSAMSPKLLETIVTKACKETQVRAIGLFNWTEPFLHPHLPELIQIVQKHGVPCYLSSNLNIGENIDLIMKANPSKLYVSVSGFTQENYGITHKGGNIVVVKENMQKLASAKERYKATTQIYVTYHRYLGNLDDETKMRAFTKQLGFKFNPVWACMMPLEKALAFAYKDTNSITNEDIELVERLALPFNEAIQVSTKYRKSPCTLRDSQIVLDCKGNAILCCTIYNQRKYSLGSFLNTPLEELQRQKYCMQKNKDICSACMNKGLHVFATYGAPEFDQIGTTNVLSHYRQALEQDHINSPESNR